MVRTSQTLIELYHASPRMQRISYETIELFLVLLLPTMACRQSFPRQQIWCFVLGMSIFSSNVSAQDVTPGPSFACDIIRNQDLKNFPFCNTSLPINERVSDLVHRLTLQEKISLLVSTASGVPRLGIPQYEWWNEALHGVAQSPGVTFGDEIPGATSFPQVILTAASFNTTLWNAIGQVGTGYTRIVRPSQKSVDAPDLLWMLQTVSTEARGMYNAGRAGLTYWSPNVNIFRDPRWGRGQETPGEDPLVVSKYAAYYVRGLQGSAYTDEDDIDPQAGISALSSVCRPPVNESDLHGLPTKMLKLSACCKHFTAYDLDFWNGTDRFHFNAEVTAQDMEETYQSPFKSCIKKGLASSLMCSYNSVNGVPACADRSLLTELARNTWGFDGYIVSDCGAVALIYDVIGYSASPEDAVSDVLEAGLDLNCGTYLLLHTEAAVKQGIVNVSTINIAVTNSLTVQMRLGMFDGDPMAQPYGSFGLDSICTTDHQNLALEAAKEGIVLLKNDENRLPLSSNDTLSLAVIGPNANASNVMLGDYNGLPCRVITPLEGLEKYTNVLYAPGCSDPSCTGDNQQEILEAAEIARKADAVVLIVGLNQAMETEGLDRADLLLPANQQNLIEAIAKATDRSIILIVMSGGPVDISAQKDDKRISCILWVGYPGQEGGTAIAQILFGDHNPGGRLPVTWYPQNFVNVSMTDMHMHANLSRGFPGRGYRFYTGQAVYFFGYGLSYSVFQYSFRTPTRTLYLPRLSELHCDQDEQWRLSVGGQDCSPLTQIMCDEMNFELGIVVRNHGPRDGGTAVLLYSVPPPNLDDVPLKQLIAFRRIFLKARSAWELTFTVKTCRDLSTVLPNGDRVLNVGLHALMVEEEVQTVSIWKEKPRE